MKKGFTIVELVVSMAIFLVVITIAVGAFVSVSRMKSLTSTIKESQQKVRLSLEIITRLSRQAEEVNVSLDGKTATLYFSLKSLRPTATKFSFLNGDLKMSDVECYRLSTGILSCPWGTETSLFGGITLSSDSLFVKDGSTIPATLNIKIHSDVINKSPYFSDTFDIETSVALENLK